MSLFDYSTDKTSTTRAPSKMNGLNDKTSEMLAAIQELTRQNERLTTELGTAQESIDLFERYRSMTQEYMKMCICSSLHYLKEQYKQCEHDYEQLSYKTSLMSSSTSTTATPTTTITTSPSSIASLKYHSFSSSSSTSASGVFLYRDNEFSVELKNGRPPKSNVGAYLDSISRNNLLRDQQQQQMQQQYQPQQNMNSNNNVIPNCRVSKRLFPSQESLLVNNKAYGDYCEQIQKLSNLFYNSPFLQSNHHYHNSPIMHDDSEDEEDEEDEEEEDEMNCSPPPLLSRRMTDGMHKSESILEAMLEKGNKSNPFGYRQKTMFSNSPIPSLSITKFDENNNSRRNHLTYEERSSIIDRLKRHEPGAKIAREYGITKQAVSAIKRRAKIAPNEQADMSIIVKKSMSSSPEATIHPVTMKKFARKFPKEMNALCLPVNPVELIKSQMKRNDSSSSNPNSLLSSFHASKSTQFKPVKEDNRNENCSSALLLSKLLKGEGVEQYEKQPKSLLIHENSSHNNLKFSNIPSKPASPIPSFSDHDAHMNDTSVDEHQNAEVESEENEEEEEGEEGEEGEEMEEGEEEEEGDSLNVCNSTDDHLQNGSSSVEAPSEDQISSACSSDIFDNCSNQYLNDLSSPAISADHSL